MATFTAPAVTTSKNRFDGTAGSVATRGQSRIQNTGVATGDRWLFTVAAGTGTGQTGTFAQGRWTYIIKVTLAGVVHTAAEGFLDVLPDLAAQDTSYDNRTKAQQIVEQCDEAILQLVTGAIQSYTIAGRTFTKFNLIDLRKTRSEYASIARGESNKGLQSIEVQCV